MRPVVALIEDNPDNRLLVDAILADRYRIVEYMTGDAGLAGVRAERPDVVLLDISLPGMDGFDVIRAIRADARLRDLPVIALTANALPGDREKCLAAGFDAYVSKPIVDEAELLELIARRLPAER